MHSPCAAGGQYLMLGGAWPIVRKRCQVVDGVGPHRSSGGSAPDRHARRTTIHAAEWPSLAARVRELQPLLGANACTRPPGPGPINQLRRRTCLARCLCVRNREPTLPALAALALQRLWTRNSTTSGYECTNSATLTYALCALRQVWRNASGRATPGSRNTSIRPLRNTSSPAGYHS